MSEHATSAAEPRMPHLFRAFGLKRDPQARGYRMTAQAYHSQAAFALAWHANHPDTQLVDDALVRVIWKPAVNPATGLIEVSRLVVLQRPERSENLFLTVPRDWVGDRALLDRAGRLWEGLSAPFQELFNVIFWDHQRFRRYCQTSSSMRGHHPTSSGNLRHSVDVAEAALKLRQRAPANSDILTLAALLHDAGKAEEYQRLGTRYPELSVRGRLLGHRETITEWVAVARYRMRLGLPESHYLSLMHALTAVANPPAWTGLRNIQTPEAHILSKVDRMSGQGDLMFRNQARDGGWGDCHPHLKEQPFTVEPRRRQSLPGLDAVVKYAREQEAAEDSKQKPGESATRPNLKLVSKSPDERGPN